MRSPPVHSGGLRLLVRRLFEEAQLPGEDEEFTEEEGIPVIFRLPSAETIRGHHVDFAAREKAFWASLNPEQLRFLGGMMKLAMQSNDPTSVIGMYYGTAEALVTHKHGECMCGESHDIADSVEDFLRGPQSDGDPKVSDGE